MTNRKRLHTHYDNLKVARTAPPEVINAAYRVLAKKYHPDRNPANADAARIMAIINTSYEVLSDLEKRREHDLWIAMNELSYGEPVTQPQPLVNEPFPNKPGRNNMLYGALWCIGGIIVTVFSYISTATNQGGGTYIIAWGAILFGAIQFIRGLSQMNETDTPDNIEDVSGSVSATCPKCGYTWMGYWDKSLKDRQCPECKETWRIS